MVELDLEQFIISKYKNIQLRNKNRPPAFWLGYRYTKTLSFNDF